MQENDKKREKIVSDSASESSEHTEPEAQPAKSESQQVKKAKDKRIWISRSRLEELEKKAQQTQFYLEHLQRLQAEFENYRKRSIKDRDEFRKFLLEDIVLELLEILDNFERALEAFRANQDIRGLRTGVEMIYRQFQDCLIRRGVSVIESLGQSFDPIKHEAVSYEESKEYPPQQVMTQMSKGYVLHGKIIRPAKVKVSKEVKASESEQAK